MVKRVYRNAATSARLLNAVKETTTGGDGGASEELQKRDVELRTVYAKIDHLEERLNQLNESMKSHQQDTRQAISLLNQILSEHKEEDKKKQRNANTFSNEEKFLQERIVNAITQNVNSVIGNEVEYFIKEEINTNVLPCK